jgi:hypothetical protein
MHRITFVDDDVLPEGHDFVFVQVEADYMVFLKTSAVCPHTLEVAWAAYRALCEESLRLRLLHVGDVGLQGQHRLASAAHVRELVAVSHGDSGLPEDLGHHPVWNAGGLEE